MTTFEEIIDLRKKEEQLAAAIRELNDAKEAASKEANNMTQQNEMAQRFALESEKKDIVKEINERTDLFVEQLVNKVNEVWKNPELKYERGEIETQQGERSNGAEKISQREDESRNKVEVFEMTVQNVENLQNAKDSVFDPYSSLVLASVSAGVLTAKAANELVDTIGEKLNDQLDKMFEKDTAKEWEKDIQIKEQKINEPFDKELRDTEKSFQKQMEYIEKKYETKEEKEIKSNDLKDTIDKVKIDIEKERAAELQKLEADKLRLAEVKEQTKNLDNSEQQKEIQKQREEFERQKELERQREIERQRQLEMQNRNRV